MPFLNWKTKEINTQGRLKSEITCSHDLLSFMNEHMMSQMVTEHTRKDKSILDLVLTNNDQAIHSIIIEKTELTDHDIVWTNLLYSQLSNIPANHKPEPDSPLDNVNLNRANWDAIREDLSPINWEHELRNMNVDEIHSKLKGTLIDTCLKHAPVHTSKLGKKLHIPPIRRSLLKVKRRINAKINFCKYKKPIDYEDKLIRLNKKRASIEIQIRDSIKEENLKKEIDVIKRSEQTPEPFSPTLKRRAKL